LLFTSGNEQVYYTEFGKFFDLLQNYQSPNKDYALTSYL